MAGKRAWRTWLANLVLVAGQLFATVLVIGVLLVVFGANRDNALVSMFLSSCDNAFDLGVFSRQNGVFHFTGGDAEKWNVLVNWGLAAIAWLMISRAVAKLIRR